MILTWVGKVRDDANENPTDGLQFPYVQQMVTCCIQYCQKEQFKGEGEAGKRIEEQST
jgi:hypothetical protein